MDPEGSKQPAGARSACPVELDSITRPLVLKFFKKARRAMCSTSFES